MRSRRGCSHSRARRGFLRPARAERSACGRNVPAVWVPRAGLAFARPGSARVRRLGSIVGPTPSRQSNGNVVSLSGYALECGTSPFNSVPQGFPSTTGLVYTSAKATNVIAPDDSRTHTGRTRCTGGADQVEQRQLRQHPPAVSPSNLVGDLEEPTPIIPKDGGALIPTRNNVEDTTSMLDPQRTHHTTTISSK